MRVAAALVAALVGLAAHELAHWAVCRAVGGRPTFIIQWRGLNTGPAVRMHLRAHTPTTVRLAAAAPLAMSVPSVLAVIAFGVPANPTVVAALAMWCLGTMPSPPDLYNIYHAGVLETYHRVWSGSHPNHAAAEGIGE